MEPVMITTASDVTVLMPSEPQDGNENSNINININSTNNQSESESHSQSSSMPPISTSTAAIPFPWKLHRILDDADVQGFNDTISWVPSENGFKVHRTKVFDAEIMPKYFNNTKYKSFQRQLNMWGFDRVGSGPNKGAYLHPYFIRGKPALCESMQRTKIKGIHSKKLRRSISISNSNSISDSDSSRSRSSYTTTTTTGCIGGIAATAIDVHASIEAAAQKVADLERQKEDIQRKLEAVLKIARTSANNNNGNSNSNSNINTMMSSSDMIPRVSLHSLKDCGQTSQDNSNGYNYNNSNSNNYLQPLPMTEGDILLFGGRNFFYMEEGKMQQQGQQQGQQQQRRVSRRYSLELKGPDTDEYILKELEEVIGGGSDGSSSSNNTAFDSQLEQDLRYALEHSEYGSSNSNATANASSLESSLSSILPADDDVPSCTQEEDDEPMLSPTPLPPSHRQQQTVHVAASNISNMNVLSSLIIGLDKPTRRFSFLSTQIHNPLDKTYQIPPKPSAMLVANSNNKMNSVVSNMNMNMDVDVNNNDVNNNNMNNGMNNVYHMSMENIRNNVRNINRARNILTTRVSF